MKRKTIQQEYGGWWTERKLHLLGLYLEAYMVILRQHSYLAPVYIDAFAGTGQRRVKPGTSSEGTTQKGSAMVALEVAEPAFRQYIFIEKSLAKCRELETLKVEYPERANHIQIVNQEASTFLTQWCSQIDPKLRAVVFLDPFGMQVEWSLLKALAATQVVDLWLLVPLGMGANRLMTRNAFPPEEWQQKLTTFFGTEDWKERFYRPRLQPDLFAESSPVEKSVDHDALRDYFVERLKTIFPGVAENPRTQRNANNSPMFLLCFATANPRPSTRNAALRIAQHLLKED